jgi:23S rRNA pseudouridine1911/1915/1917 synthase
VQIPDALDGERVDRVVATLVGCSRADAAALVDDGGVRLGGTTVRSRSQRVASGDELELDVALAPAVATTVAADPTVVVPIVYEDADVVVVDKPAGLVVHPGAGNRSGTLVNGLLARYPELAAVGDPARPGIVHRLDKQTSGLLAVARGERAYRSLVDQLGRRTVVRRYLALVWGHFDVPRGMVDAPVGRSGRTPTRMAVSTRGREARTRYEVVDTGDDPEVTLVSCTLETGRTHQVRVHLAAIGHPVVGDPAYGGARQSLPLAGGRFFLHATHLAFAHPATGDPVSFDSPLPPDLAAVVSGL